MQTHLSSCVAPGTQKCLSLSLPLRSEHYITGTKDTEMLYGTVTASLGLKQAVLLEQILS